MKTITSSKRWMAGAVALAGCLACSSRPGDLPSASLATSAETTVLVGSLHTVWTGFPTYRLAITADSTVELLLDRAVRVSDGAPLDRDRLTVEGTFDGANRFHVTIIRSPSETES